MLKKHIRLKLVKSSIFYKILFVISLSILLFMSSITYKHLNNLSKSTDDVVHSYKITLELEQMISHVKDAETGIRGFIITRDSIFLKPYNGSLEKVNNCFIRLKKLTKDNKEQYAYLTNLYILINKRYEHFNYNLKYIEQYNQINDNKFNENFVLGRKAMDSIRIQINKMIYLENKFLKTRNEAYAYQIYITPIFTITIVILTLILIILSFIKINNDLKKLKDANDLLMFSKESSDQAEILGNYSSWVWNLDNNELLYSDNQYRLLGCKPQEFEPQEDSILKYIHPEDVPFIINIIKDIQIFQKLSTIEFRIVRKDNGEIRYLKSVGKLVLNNLGQRNIIGTNSDVTLERLASLEIQERNLELERSNNELASFNHVASHDLQEPLRKIQTFISRFSEDDKAKLSENARGYLSKIEDSSSRMRVLIDDLLLFSRTNKSEKIFYKTDLNEILENSKNEFSQTIIDKKAVITSSNLPTTDAITFQIQQLFNNLIGNSLKYSRENEPVNISITSELILDVDYPILNTRNNDRYHKITFIDNGMGFEQEFNEKIFVLFNRLHPINDFPGTGIGLTICKKIAENHKGFLFAEGHPNQGATFNLFLPKNS